MINNCIITPTFLGHFPCIELYLKSFNKYVVDKNKVPIFFTIEAVNKEEFFSLIKPYQKDMDIRVIIFDDILKKHSIYLTPENLRKKYGKFSYQTLKKFYTMLEVDARFFLVLDSESTWIRDTNMTNLFEAYFTNPRIYYSIMDNPGVLKKAAYDNVDYILGNRDNYWYIEHFMWYYDKAILLDLFKEYGSPVEIVERVYRNMHRTIGVFEILLYYGFIGKRQEKYGYKSYNVSEICKQRIGKEIVANYEFELRDAFHGNFGLLEQTMMFLNDQNTEAFADLFKRLNIDILRCECGQISKNQKRFDEVVQAHIFAASQNHMFGIEPLKSERNHISNVLKSLIKTIMRKCFPAYKVACENRELIFNNNTQLVRLENDIKQIKDALHILDEER